jgi:outer membrane protein assembly factor BamB
MNKARNAALLYLTTLLIGGVCFADDWPQFRGPNRDGKSAETGLLKTWPPGGPRLLWSVKGLGIGFSSAAIAHGSVYTTGMLDGEGFLFAYDLAGRLRWKVSYGPEWRKSYKGTRTTPTVDDDRVYIFSGLGRLACFDAETGRRIWSVDTLKKFDGRNITWGMSGSPLIDGDKVYCTPGGKRGLIVALNKWTGKTIWATTGLNESSAYASPILIEDRGSRLVVNLVQKSVVGVSPDDGRLLWRVPFKCSFDTGAITPIYKDGRLFVTSVVELDATTGGLMLRLSDDLTTPTKKWTQPVLDGCHGGVVLVDGYLYGSNFDTITSGNWVCLDWNSGKVMYEARWAHNKGAIIYADGMLYCYAENSGEVALVKASPQRFDIVSSFRVTQGTGPHWAHPAISDGRLYIRHGDALMAYDIAGK